MKLTILLLSFCFFIAGCKSFHSNSDSETYEAHYVNSPIKVDGKLNEPSWEKAKSLNFKPLPKYLCTEKGTVKILWDNKYVYVGGIFYDSDIVQESSRNWEHHYETGDVMEVFLRPLTRRYYWEIYATPNNLKSSFFFLSRGRLGLPSGFKYKIQKILVMSNCKGTLNNTSDYDELWTTELAIPKEELEKYGEKITHGKIWRFLIGRYNYSAYFDNRELTASVNPQSNSFHDFKSWSYLKFVNP